MTNEPIGQVALKRNIACASEIMDIFRTVNEASDPAHQLPDAYVKHGKLIQATIEDEYGKLARAFDATYPAMPLAHVIGVHILAANAVGMCLAQMIVRMSALLLEQCLDLPGMSAKFAPIKTDMRSQLHVRHLLFQMLLQYVMANMVSSEMSHLHAESIMEEQNSEEKNRPLLH